MTYFPHKGDTKVKQRKALLAARHSRSAAELARAATAVRATAAQLVRRAAARPDGLTVAAYVPIGNEPGGPGLPAELAAPLPPGALLLPVLRPDLDLDWAAWDPARPLVAAGRGMREPAGPRLGRAALARAGLVIVPALAVDRRGVRLGRGGGSYDRALARVSPDTLKVALLHDGELVDDLPAEPHDQRVQAVITPTAGLVRLDEGACDSALLALGE